MREYFIWLAKLITFVFVIFFLIPLLLIGAIGGAATALNDQAPQVLNNKRVAVVELEGMIMDSKDVVSDLYAQVENDAVRAIVLRIDSPGGAVGPSQDIFSAVSTLKSTKPIVVSMGGVAASGGLYSALGASKVFAQPGTLTGSIGVILQLPNFREIADKVGVSFTTIKAGALKDVGNSYRAMTPEEKTFLENLASKTHDEFIRAVAEGRNLDEKTVRTFADGRVLLGSQGKELGLVDEFGDIYDAASAALTLAGAPLGEGEFPELYYPRDKYKELRKFLDMKGLYNRVFGFESTQLLYLMP